MRDLNNKYTYNTSRPIDPNTKRKWRVFIAWKISMLFVARAHWYWLINNAHSAFEVKYDKVK